MKDVLKLSLEDILKIVSENSNKIKDKVVEETGELKETVLSEIKELRDKASVEADEIRNAWFKHTLLSIDKLQDKIQKLEDKIRRLERDADKRSNDESDDIRPE